MPIAIPISVRREGDSQGGNRIAGAQLAAPAGIADPRERMAQIGAAVRAARAEPAIESLALVAPALAQLPAPLISRIAGGLTEANDLQASNVPGSASPATGGRPHRAHVRLRPAARVRLDDHAHHP